MSFCFVHYFGSFKGNGVHCNISKNAPVVLFLSLLVHGDTLACFRGSPSQDCSEISYTGAVCEYAPYTQWTEGHGAKILEENTKAFLSLASQAKQQGADILIYPEYGLTGRKTPNNESEYITLSQHVPAPENSANSCLKDGNKHTYDALKELSCGARKMKIYLVVNLIEWEEKETKDGVMNIFYNTQVVFDRNGVLIAKYRKKNLFLEDEMTPGKEPPIEATFHTDFGVTFSLQVCFDILYEEPTLANIFSGRTADVAMSTLWMDELPFLTAPQMFSSWATGLGINLLVSNYHDPSKGASGSGIFSQVIKGTPYYYVYGDGIEQPSLLVRNITTKKHPEKCPEQLVKPQPEINGKEQVSTKEYVKFFIYENMANFTSAILERTSGGKNALQTHCDRSFCCKANYSFDRPLNGSATYHIMAYDGNVYKSKVYRIYIQVCAIAYCLNENITSCARIDERLNLSNSLKMQSLQGSFQTKFIYPSILRQNLTLVERERWTFEQQRQSNNWTAQLYGDPHEHSILVASMYARIYDKIYP